MPSAPNGPREHSGALMSDLPGASLGHRLRAERERRRITLESIAANTKINVGLLQGLERDDASRWPSGIFRRSFIRDYSAAIGLDPDETMREFLAQFPDPGETDAPAPVKCTHRTDADRTDLRLTLDGADASPGYRGFLEQAGRRFAAFACDLLACLSIAGLLFLALDQWWQPLALTAIGYYACGVLLGTRRAFFFVHARRANVRLVSSNHQLRRANALIRKSCLKAGEVRIPKADEARRLAARIAQPTDSPTARRGPSRLRG